MRRDVLLILISNRKESADKVQKTLTAWGCVIKTRLGLHDGVLDNCSDSGLLILEVVGDTDNHRELARKLGLIKGVSAELVSLQVEDES